ncbi:MAG: type II toxin-antitoxin system PemK/MazF family toxin [Arcobacteraceae bacterium]|jgi:mRNA interferase MazF|nr:type II toxin-antitoxin system PemK/MazF family toxin [Arcobacteraceae bacterium]
MSYKKCDILLVKFPFTDFSELKKRPVLVIKDENEYGDIVCFQITSKNNQSNIIEIFENNLNEPLKLKSFVKYDKCFTIDSKIIDKKLTSVTDDFLQKIKNLFCSEVF